MAIFAANKSGWDIFAPTVGCNQENKSNIALVRFECNFASAFHCKWK